MCICFIPIFYFYNTNVKYKNINLENAKNLLSSSFVNTKKADDEVFYERFDINKEDVEEYIYYYPNDSMLVDEYLIIKLKSKLSINSTKNAINKHIEDEKSKFMSYGVDQYSILMESKIIDSFPYIIYVVNSDVDKILNIIDGIIK